MAERADWHGRLIGATLVVVLYATVAALLWATGSQTDSAGPSRPSSAGVEPKSATKSTRRGADRREILQAGAVGTDCPPIVLDPEINGYRFNPGCPGSAPSPNGRLAVAMTDRGRVELTDRAGGVLDEIAALNAPGFDEDMPFTVSWSPKSDWFFANHYLGSSLERLRVFHIVNRGVFEQSGVFANATRIAVSRYPCLGRKATVVASGWRWSRDGRRIAMAVYARPDACQEDDGPSSWTTTGEWEVLWMIGDVETGRIDPASVRVRPGGVGPMPTDGPYATL
jgi:hypothetical protein